GVFSDWQRRDQRAEAQTPAAVDVNGSANCGGGRCFDLLASQVARPIGAGSPAVGEMDVGTMERLLKSRSALGNRMQEVRRARLEENLADFVVVQPVE